MTPRPDILIFSDLDGTLLDHHSYSWAPAAPALARMRAGGVGLVLASSKTAAEMAPLRAEMGFGDYPAIVENGGGLLPPEGQALGADERARYGALRAALAALPPGFAGFGDMSAQEVAEVTGLSEAGAALAKQRAFSEPGLWSGAPEALAAFEAGAARAGLTLRRGGRFLTASFGGTKAQQMARLRQEMRPRLTLALGDAPNDIEMLEQADFGVIIANDDAPALASLPGEAAGRITRTARPGPEGWAEAVSAFLTEHAPSEDP